MRHPVTSKRPFSAATWRRALRERPLVVKIAGRYLGHGLTRNELIDEGLIGVCLAAETYRKSKGKWPAHAARYVENAIKEAIYHGQIVCRPFRSLWKAESEDRRVYTCRPQLDILAGRNDRIPPGDWALAEAALGCLDERERAVILARCGLDGPARTLEEIGADLGRTRQRVQQIEKRAVEKLRRAVRGAS